MDTDRLSFERVDDFLLPPFLEDGGILPYTPGTLLIILRGPWKVENAVPMAVHRIASALLTAACRAKQWGPVQWETFEYLLGSSMERTLEDIHVLDALQALEEDGCIDFIRLKGSGKHIFLLSRFVEFAQQSDLMRTIVMEKLLSPVVGERQ